MAQGEEYGADGRADRIMALAIDEICAAPALPLSLPLPADEKLAECCRCFIEHPFAQGRQTFGGATLRLAVALSRAASNARPG